LSKQNCVKGAELVITVTFGKVMVATYFRFPSLVTLNITG
jgi:hypothetical protein